MKIISVVGFHNTGKTTTVENLITYLKNNGFTVSSIKDIHREGFTMEKEGSNSQRHLKASNTYVFARGEKETYLIWDRKLTFSEMLSYINTDWLIIEGMNEENFPRIIAARNESDVDSFIKNKVIAVTGALSESISEYKSIPVINAIQNIEMLGKLVETLV